MSDPSLHPDQFLYGRKGPWPQPSPSHPLREAYEVLNIPPIETLMWNATIGQRLMRDEASFAPQAAMKALANHNYTTPDDEEFARILFKTAYIRYLKPTEAADQALLARRGDAAPAAWRYDFRAMELVEPLPGMYCAPTVVYIAGSPPGNLKCVAIKVGDVLVIPSDPAWGLAKVYALQGAAYHMLFVVHPTQHFPMDSVNAITKTAVPRAHPLFQLLYPHTAYTLALDNTVLESDYSVVNDNAAGAWFDPLTGNGYNLKLLFGAGYTGLPSDRYGDAYPAYDYMRPALLCMGNVPSGVYDTDYSRWLTAYFERAFLPFCKVVAQSILKADPNDTYVVRWARYLHSCVMGFPDEKQILTKNYLAYALAIYLWDVTVAHGADHHSFACTVSVVNKFLRIRRAPPTSPADGPVLPGQVFTGDDQLRAEVAQQMFFLPWTLPPNLDQTYYAFTDPLLLQEQMQFHVNLSAVASDPSLVQFMPLKASTPEGYALTIPASIQY